MYVLTYTRKASFFQVVPMTFTFDFELNSICTSSEVVTLECSGPWYWLEYSMLRWFDLIGRKDWGKAVCDYQCGVAYKYRVIYMLIQGHAESFKWYKYIHKNFFPYFRSMSSSNPASSKWDMYYERPCNSGGICYLGTYRANKESEETSTVRNRCGTLRARCGHRYIAAGTAPLRGLMSLRISHRPATIRLGGRFLPASYIRKLQAACYAGENTILITWSTSGSHQIEIPRYTYVYI